jgi:serine protease inhibitor
MSSKTSDRSVPSVGEGTIQFACNLYNQMAGTTSGNIFFSPSSIWTALAMTYAGAAGETAEPKTFKADHPFLFLIRDRESGLILFCGRVVVPGDEA